MSQIARTAARQRDFVGALEKGLAVIQALGAAASAQTLSEVARRTGLTRAAARRYLLTLARLGYVQIDGRTFVLTPLVLRLGYAYFSTAPLPRLAQPLLERIGERTREVASLVVLDGAEVLFLAQSSRRRIVSAASGVGSRIPAYCAAAGRVLLAARPEGEVERLLRTLRPTRLTPKTKTSIREILAEVAKARQIGYAISDEELELGLRAIAVPVRDARGEVRVALAVSLQAAHLTPAQMVDKLLPELQEGSRELGAML